MEDIKAKIVDMSAVSTDISSSENIIGELQCKDKIYANLLTKQLLSATIEDKNHIVGNVAISNSSQTKNVVIIPQMFGAKADGETDDTKAINKALEYIHNKGGGVLFLVAGTYLISGVLWVGNNTSIIGEGIGNTVIKLSDSTDWNNTVYSCLGSDYQEQPQGNAYRITGFATMRNKPIDYVRFSDFEFDGNCSSFRDWTIQAFYNNKPTCNGISLDEFWGSISPKRAYISNVYIHDTIGNGIVAHTQGDIIIENSIFENSDIDHLIYIQNRGNSYCKINNCFFGGYAKDTFVQTDGCQFSNCSFNNLVVNPNYSDGQYYIVNSLDRSRLFGDNITNTYNNMILHINMDNWEEYTLYLFEVQGRVNVNSVFVDFTDSKEGVTYRRDCMLAHFSNAQEDYSSGGSFSNVNVKNAPLRFGLALFSKTLKEDVLITNVVVDYSKVGVWSTLGTALCQIDNGTINENVVFQNLFIYRCGRLFRAENGQVNGVIVKDSIIHNLDAPLTILGAKLGDCPFTLRNVQLDIVRGNSLNYAQGIHFEDVKIDKLPIGKVINQLPTEFVFFGDTWVRNNKPIYYNGTEWVDY